MRPDKRKQAEQVDGGRRRLLIGGLTATGGFLLGVPLTSLQAEAGMKAGGSIGFFVEITPDNQVVIGVAQPEIGQGVRLSLIHISEPTRPFTLSRMPSSA